MGTQARHVRAADRAKRSLFAIAEGLARRSEAARKSLTEWRVRPGPGRACAIPLLSAPLLAYSPAAFAGPTPCQGLGGPSVTCTGNQIDGVVGGVSFPINNTTSSLTVNNLTEAPNVNVFSSAYGILWSLTPGFTQSAMNLVFSTPTLASIARSLSTTDFAAGVDVDSSGGPNGNGRAVSLAINGAASAQGLGGAAVYGLDDANRGSNASGNTGDSEGKGEQAVPCS